MTPATTRHELQRHHPGDPRPASRRRGRWSESKSSQPSLFTSVKPLPNPSKRPARGQQPDRRGMVDEQPMAQIAVKRRRLAKVIGHGQVEHAVAVEVATGDAHPRLVHAVCGRPPRRLSRLLEPESSAIVEQIIRPTCRWRHTDRSCCRRRGPPRQPPAHGHRDR